MPEGESIDAIHFIALPSAGTVESPMVERRGELVICNIVPSSHAHQYTDLERKKINTVACLTDFKVHLKRVVIKEDCALLP